MNKQVYINLPVKNLEVSTRFYEALGFTKNEQFSAEYASCMVWSESIMFMLLTHEFYRTFIKKDIADTHTTNSVLLALSMSSKEEVEMFAKKAKEAGGDYYNTQSKEAEGYMVSLEVTDPDGHMIEPIWMDMRAFEKGE